MSVTLKPDSQSANCRTVAHAYPLQEIKEDYKQTIILNPAHQSTDQSVCVCVFVCMCVCACVTH